MMFQIRLLGQLDYDLFIERFECFRDYIIFLNIPKQYQRLKKYLNILFLSLLCFRNKLFGQLFSF